MASQNSARAVDRPTQPNQPMPSANHLRGEFSRANCGNLGAVLGHLQLTLHHKIYPSLCHILRRQDFTWYSTHTQGGAGTGYMFTETPSRKRTAQRTETLVFDFSRDNGVRFYHRGAKRPSTQRCGLIRQNTRARLGLRTEFSCNW